jgi:AraC-like DNA-binding protein
MNEPLVSARDDCLEIARTFKRLAPKEGYNLTPLPNVRLLRSNKPLSRAPVLYDPGIVIVCQGRKRGFLGDEVYLYDSQHYLAVSVPVPFSMETDASAEEPLLAIYLRLDLPLATKLLLEVNESGHEIAEPKGLVSTRMDDRIRDAVRRLLEAFDDPIDAALLGPSIVREIYYRVLKGEQGGSMRAALSGRGHFGKIAKALKTIHTSFAADLSVDQLAATAGMSVASFHAYFKAVTCASPMKYVQTTRLHQARLLMVRSGLTAAVAASEVGYESPSQFSREFKRLFGLPPSEEAMRMRKAFANPHPPEGAQYIASH